MGNVSTETNSMFQAMHDLAERKASGDAAPTDATAAAASSTSTSTVDAGSTWDRVVRQVRASRTAVVSGLARGRADAATSYRQATTWLSERPVRALVVGVGLGFLAGASGGWRR